MPAAGHVRASASLGGEEKKRKSLEWNYKGQMLVAHCYGLLPRLFPCAATEVRDDTMDDQCAECGHSRAEHFHLPRCNLHVSLYAPECFTELVRDSGARSGHTVVLEPTPPPPPINGAHANKMPVVLQHGGAPRNRRRRRRGRSRRKVLPVQPLALQSEFGTELQLRARRQLQVARRDHIPTFCT